MEPLTTDQVLHAWMRCLYASWKRHLRDADEPEEDFVTYATQIVTDAKGVDSDVVALLEDVTRDPLLCWTDDLVVN